MPAALDHIGLPVADIDVTIDFYSRILGLRLIEKRIDRGLAFATIEISDSLAIAIWETKEQHCHHLAFALPESEFDAAYEALRHEGIRYGNATDGFGEDGNLYGEKLNMKGPDSEMGAKGLCKSLYFEDPNGHSIEILCY